MTKLELKEQIDAILDAATIETESITPEEYVKRHFLTISEAILFADAQGVALTHHPVNQFHTLCKSGKIRSVPIGEKNTRIIVRESLEAWIAAQLDKQRATPRR